MGDTEIGWLLIAVLLALVGIGVLFASLSRVSTRLPIAQLLAGRPNPIRPRRFGIDVARRRLVVGLGLLAASVTTYDTAMVMIGIPAGDRLPAPAVVEFPQTSEYELKHPIPVLPPAPGPRRHPIRFITRPSHRAYGGPIGNR